MTDTPVPPQPRPGYKVSADLLDRIAADPAVSAGYRAQARDAANDLRHLGDAATSFGNALDAIAATCRRHPAWTGTEPYHVDDLDLFVHRLVRQHPYLTVESGDGRHPAAQLDEPTRVAVYDIVLDVLRSLYLAAGDGTTNEGVDALPVFQAASTAFALVWEQAVAEGTAVDPTADPEDEPDPVQAMADLVEQEGDADG